MPAPQNIHQPHAGQTTLRRYRHFLIGALIYLFLVQCAVLFRGIPKAVAGFADFRSFYAAGYMVRSGDAHRLYDLNLQEQAQTLVTPERGVLPFLYPAYSALLFVPLSLLSWRSAYLVFFGVNLLLLWLSARFLRDSLPHLSGLWPPLLLVLFFCFFPAGEALMQGQTSILLLALYCAAFAALQKGRPLRAGVCLGLAILKMQTALPVLLLFLLWRRWRVAAGFLAGAATALAVSLSITGYPAFLQYWRSLFLMATSASGVTSRFAIAPAMMPNLFGLAALLSGGAAWGSRLAAAMSLLIVLWIASRPCSLPTALIVGLLLSRYLGVHDLVLLLLPMSLALNYFLGHPDEFRARALAVTSAVLLLPPAYLFLMGRSLLSALAVVLLALLFFLALPVPAANPWRRRPDSPATLRNHCQTDNLSKSND